MWEMKVVDKISLKGKVQIVNFSRISIGAVCSNTEHSLE